MPLLTESSYRAPWWCRSPQWQILWASLARPKPRSDAQRERLELSDGDFLDLDWQRRGSHRLLVLSHGLEGNSQRTYILGMARAAVRRGWDVVAWNFRGCSGEPNRLPRSYHSGASEDLAAVVAHVTARGYDDVALAGFSLGGNLTLKFLGEGRPEAAPVRGAVAISVPCDLEAAAHRMAGPDCRVYMRRFLQDLGLKMAAKQVRFGAAVPATDWRPMRTFAEFDGAFTAPLHGFSSAEDYWTKCSAVRFLPRIQVPVLLLNAADDPFLAPECFPKTQASESLQVSLEIPGRGGHVGFVGGGAYPGEYWSERRTGEFLDQVFRG